MLTKAHRKGERCMEIYYASYNHKHKGDFNISFPAKFNGRDVHILMIFKTKTIIKENDEERTIDKGTFALYTPNANHSIQGCGDEYIDDWIVFNPDSNDLDLIESLSIPLNKAVKLNFMDLISDLIHKLAFEFHDAYNPYRNDVMQLIMQLIFFRVSQSLYLQIPLCNKNRVNEKKYNILINIRNEIYCSPGIVYSIDELAKKAFMSRSYFQHTYKKMFGVTVTQEIMKSRLNHSKYYLSCTDMAIKKIAEVCGFNSDIYYVRSFKKIFGITPTEYRDSLQQKVDSRIND